MPVPLGIAAAWALGLILTGAGLSAKAAQEIIASRTRKKQNAKFSEVPDIKNYPKGTIINTTTSPNGNKSYTIAEPGKPPYAFQPMPSPVKFSDDTIKQIDNLAPNQRVLVDSIVTGMQQNPDEFLNSIQKIDPSKLEEIAQGKLPTAEDLGFPATNPNFINQLMQDTDFGPIEEAARQKFHKETIPSLAERFVGSGGLHSSALRGQLGKAASDLETQLAALRSQYGLQRANALGGLTQKQQALDVGRAQALGNLGLAQQGQRFNQQQGLANLGLQQNQQQLAQQGQQQNFLANLLGRGAYSIAGQPPAGPGVADYATGAGLSTIGLGGQLYGQQQANQNMLDILKTYNKA